MSSAALLLARLDQVVDQRPHLERQMARGHIQRVGGARRVVARQLQSGSTCISALLLSTGWAAKSATRPMGMALILGAFAAYQCSERKAQSKWLPALIYQALVAIVF